MEQTTGIPEISDYYGLIVTLARQCWLALPPDYKRWIDLDDVVGEAITHYYRVGHKYDATKKTRFSTFIFVAIQNHLRSYLQQYRVAMRTGITVNIDDLSIAGTEDISEQMFDAEMRVNRALELASPSLFDYLARCIFGPERQPASSELTVEMQRVCRMAGAEIDHFRQVARLASIQ